MTKLFNIREVILNGNEITKVAKHYNKNAFEESKTKTLATVQTLEEAIDANRVICDYELNKQRELSMTYDSLNVKNTTDSTYVDTMYGVKTEVTDEHFIYPIDALASVSSDTIFLPSTIKTFGGDEVYHHKEEFATSDSFTTSGDNLGIYCNTKLKKIEKDFYASNVGFNATDVVKFFKDRAFSEPITLEDCRKIVSGDVELYQPKSAVYLISVNGSGYIYLRCLVTGTDWQDEYKNPTSDARKYKIRSTSDVLVEGIPKTLSKIIVSDKLSNVNFRFNSESKSNTQTLTIVTKCFSLYGRESVVNHGRIYIKGSFENCGLGKNLRASVYVGTDGEIHLGKNFFADKDLDEAYALASAASPAYMFGNFVDLGPYASTTRCKSIFVVRDDLNTIVKDDTTLLTMIRKILNLSSSCGLAFEESWM